MKARARVAALGAALGVLLLPAVLHLPGLPDAMPAAATTPGSDGIGSAAIGQVVVDRFWVDVPVSVQAWPSFGALVAQLYRGGIDDPGTAFGYSALRQRSAGSTTWQGTLSIGTGGIPLGQLTLGVQAYRGSGGPGEQAEALKEVAVTVKSGSRTALTPARSGSSVTLTATATYYHANLERWLSYGGQQLSFQVQLPSGAWSQFASARTDSRGVARAVGVSGTPRVWRVVTPEATVVWSSTSPAVTA